MFSTSSGDDPVEVRWLAPGDEDLVVRLGDDRALSPEAAAELLRDPADQRGSMDGADRTQTLVMTDVWVERDGRPQLVTRHVSPLDGVSRQA